MKKIDPLVGAGSPLGPFGVPAAIGSIPYVEGRELTVEEIAELLRRKAAGEWEALEDVWADEVVTWHNFDGIARHATRSQKAAGSRRELEAFEQAMPDFCRSSTVHLAPASNLIFELSRWTGTFRGSVVAVPVCHVYSVEKGRIARVDIYADSVQRSLLAEVLSSVESTSERV